MSPIGAPRPSCRAIRPLLHSRGPDRRPAPAPEEERDEGSCSDRAMAYESSHVAGTRTSSGTPSPDEGPGSRADAVSRRRLLPHAREPRGKTGHFPEPPGPDHRLVPPPRVEPGRALAPPTGRNLTLELPAQIGELSGARACVVDPLTGSPPPPAHVWSHAPRCRCLRGSSG